MLVATQMGFCVVGVFLNNVAFITLKELPSMRASTYNILLCHIVLGTRCCIVVTYFKMVKLELCQTLFRFRTQQML